jgi:hypothetical protein
MKLQNNLRGIFKIDLLTYRNKNHEKIKIIKFIQTLNRNFSYQFKLDKENYKANIAIIEFFILIKFFLIY